MKITKYLVLSLALVGSAYSTEYTAEQARKVMEMLHFLQLNANCAAANATILSTPAKAFLTDEQKKEMEDHVKIYAQNFVEFKQFLRDKDQASQRPIEKVKEIAQK